MFNDYKYIENSSLTIPYVKKLDGNEKYDQARYFIKEAKNIVFLTGAGLSTSVGIPDFRSKEGWYSKSPETILSRDNFFRKPKEVCEFLFRYLKLIDVEPTESHKIIADLEKTDKNISVITQNVDMLHTRAGSTNVIEFHGSFKKAKCYKCKKEYSIDKILNEDVYTDEFKIQCDCRGYIKPDIVLFGEDVHCKKEAIKIMKKADLVIIMGTLMAVQPFADLPSYCKIETPYIIINKDATYLDDHRMSVVFNEDCDKVLNEIINIK